MESGEFKFISLESVSFTSRRVMALIPKGRDKSEYESTEARTKIILKVTIANGNIRPTVHYE